jgi:hypothetical protein
MKLITRITICFAALGVAFLTSCKDSHEGHDHDDHDHDHAEHDHDHAEHDHDHDDGHTHANGDDEQVKDTPGPNGGRILTEVEPHLEFLLNDDHSIQIIALTDDARPTPIGTQVINVTGGDRSAPADINFSKKGDALVSNGTFPKGKNLPVIVSIQSTPDAEPSIARFTLNLSDCPTCDFKEYACICGHADGDHDH